MCERRVQQIKSPREVQVEGAVIERERKKKCFWIDGDERVSGKAKDCFRCLACLKCGSLSGMSSQSDKVHAAALEILIPCSALFRRGVQREVGGLDVFKHAASSGTSRGELMSSSQNKFSFPKAVDISLGKRDFNP